MTGDGLPSTWESRWIWADHPVAVSPDPLAAGERQVPRDRYCLLRGSVGLTAPARSAWVRAAGDSRFKLYVNGVRVARGPLRSPPDRQPSELVDVTEHLRPGHNVVAAVVRFYGTPTSSWIPAPLTLGLGGGCFAAELYVDDRLLLATGGGWTACLSQAWKPSSHETALSGFLPEDHDARLLPEGWNSPGFDDGDWPAAVVLDAGDLGSRDRQSAQTVPFGRLPARTVPTLDGRTRTPVRT
ncbi:MAG: alpha-L-rhamnosidase, partial [Frankiales bacterium]|nr:alpha-L-rhamnosidase [Frankiales bacterium]